jgi:tRNA-5-taurinomethyluridine 2-sulfurtransferase
MKIAVLLSGGVDSSVALRLLHEQGHELTAFYLKIWLEDELSYLGDCPWEEDLDYARRVCEAVNVPLEVIPMQKEYWDKVVKYTISEVKAGRTPNPDILCNQQIKFGAFYEKIGDEYDKVASGHYAGVEEEDGIFYLKTVPDPIKDQTYFLSQLSQEQISRVLFPLADYKKEEVRQLAQKFDLPNKARKDSQGICFLGKFKFKDFVKHHLGEEKGDLIELETGEKIGEHNGFWYHTIGQRQGLGLSGGPWFVVKKDVEKNIVYISRDYHSEDKVRDSFDVGEIKWISGYEPKINHPVNLRIKIRHGEHSYQAEVTFSSPESAAIHLKESDQGIASGQFTAFYRGDTCLGSGVIQ